MRSFLLCILLPSSESAVPCAPSPVSTTFLTPAVESSSMCALTHFILRSYTESCMRPFQTCGMGCRGSPCTGKPWKWNKFNTFWHNLWPIESWWVNATFCQFQVDNCKRSSICSSEKFLECCDQLDNIPPFLLARLLSWIANSPAHCDYLPNKPPVQKSLRLCFLGGQCLKQLVPRKQTYRIGFQNWITYQSDANRKPTGHGKWDDEEVQVCYSITMTESPTCSGIGQMEGGALDYSVPLTHQWAMVSLITMKLTGCCFILWKNWAKKMTVLDQTATTSGHAVKHRRTSKAASRRTLISWSCRADVAQNQTQEFRIFKRKYKSSLERFPMLCFVELQLFSLVITVLTQ